jgi:Protein of unknown function (DUF1566)
MPANAWVFAMGQCDERKERRKMKLQKCMTAFLLAAAICNANTAPFTFLADGNEVIDNDTGLVWRRCVEGMTLRGSQCAGTAHGFTFETARAYATYEAAATGAAWRLPNLGELLTIADAERASPAIDSLIFPNTPVNKFWTSSLFVRDSHGGVANPSDAMFVDFNKGGYHHSLRGEDNLVRLVRDRR